MGSFLNVWNFFLLQTGMFKTLTHRRWGIENICHSRETGCNQWSCSASCFTNSLTPNFVLVQYDIVQIILYRDFQFCTRFSIFQRFVIKYSFWILAMIMFFFPPENYCINRNVIISLLIAKFLFISDHRKINVSLTCQKWIIFSI